MTVSAACLGAGISRRRYYRWLPRWRAQGRAGLVERVSRPHHSPRRLSLEQEIRIIAVRLLLGWGPDRIEAIVGLPASSCHRVLRRGGLVRTKAAPAPVVRYEHEHPGDMIHLDTKRLGRIVDGPGHRATGNRKGRRSGAGREVLHVAIDDAGRLVHAEILADEKKVTTARFTIRAPRWFRDRGGGSSASSRTTAAPIAAVSSDGCCDARASSTRAPGPIGHRPTARWSAGTGPCCRSVSTCTYSAARDSVDLRWSASSGTTTGCALTWASVDGLRTSGSATSLPPETVTNVSGDYT